MVSGLTGGTNIMAIAMGILFILIGLGMRDVQRRLDPLADPAGDGPGADPDPAPAV